MAPTVDYAASTNPVDGFIDSSQFLKQFIVIDDNFAPYRQLGYEADSESYGLNYGLSLSGNGNVGIKDIVTMTCPLPEKVFLPAKDAREKAMKHCEKFRSILLLNGAEPYVRRLFVTSSPAFKRRKLEAAKSGKDPASSLVASLHLPHFLWVMEISTIDAYKCESCIAEVILDATAGSADDGIIYMRIGDQMYFAGKGQTVWRTISGPKQFAQYTHNLGEK